MATTTSIVLAFVLALFAARFDPSASQSLKASVSCLDCDHHFDYSGIEVAVKCDKAEKLSVVSTDSDGSFSVTELPVSSPASCLAKLVGGPSQLYVPKSNTVSRVIPTTTHKELNAYTLSTPLAFYTSRPATPKSQLGSSKNIDIPLPPEWGLAPSSYYVPFFPIIGIP
uniref:Pollen Ole e 1 allergen and extensin family protein n=1 Tax=Kalanchoe fedtschenkoi TaxID=63787 RepID=A0A7N0VEI2_KALFE